MLAGPTDSRSRTSRPGKAQPPPGINAAPCLMPSPGGAALTGPTDSRSRTSRPGKAQPPPGNKAAPCLMASPGGAALTGPTRCEPVRGPGRPGKVPAATRQNNGATGNVPARAALSRATVSMLFPDRLRSQYFFCAMSLMALGAHRGGQSPPPPVPPGSGQQHRRCAVPSTYPCRLRVGPRQRPCKTRPSARIHAGCPGLPGTSQRC